MLLCYITTHSTAQVEAADPVREGQPKGDAALMAAEAFQSQGSPAQGSKFQGTGW